jgi:predicted  nucleic acid-binding Zn-ribbon protein
MTDATENSALPHHPSDRRKIPAYPRLLRRLSLKPYGDELLTGGADFWIFSARLIVLTMALAEAMAWGYMGALISRAYPLVTAAVAAIFVFILIWIIDATFMTLDLSRGFYERMLVGKKETPALEKLKLVGGIGARVAIVSASLFITAPFLAQAIFAGDVQDEMARLNASAIASKRAEIEGPFTARAADLRREQTALEQQRVQEVAGSGPSGRYGRGPVLETIERQLAEKRDEIAAIEAARAAALSGFDSLSRSELESQHGVRFIEPGVQSSGALLDDLLESEQFGGAELAVRAFLAFLFLGLLILKLFQPRSVAVYFNEQLHSIWDEYRKGLFDSWLPERERAGEDGTMEPLRFEDWCLNTYAAVRREDHRRNATAREIRMHELLVEQWRRLERDAREELDPLTRRAQTLNDSIAQLEAELHQMRTTTAGIETELQTITASHHSMREHIDRGGMGGAVFEQAMAAFSKLADRRHALEQRLRESEGAIASFARQLEAGREQLAALRAEIARKEVVIAEAERRIGDERMKLAEVIARQGELWAAQPAA